MPLESFGSGGWERGVSKWIAFIEEATTRKTRVWSVVPKDGMGYLGLVQWYSPWRKYSFFPGPNTLYEPTCLRDIAAFIDEQMAARKTAKSSAA